MKKERLRLRDLRKNLKKYLWITGALLLVLMIGAVVAVREITASGYANVETAAQVALDMTLLTRIDEVQRYTGGMNGFWFRGSDEAGRELYVWTSGDKAVAMQYAQRGLSREAAIERALTPVWAADPYLVRPSMKEQPLQPMTEVIHALPGPVLQKMRTEFRLAESRFVWELYGKFADGKYGYTYLDFKSGDVLWQIALSEPK